MFYVLNFTVGLTSTKMKFENILSFICGLYGRVVRISNTVRVLNTSGDSNSNYKSYSLHGHFLCLLFLTN